jgi:carbamoyltransferase
MKYLGISCGFHDAAATVLDEYGEILFAGHSERYSKKKHDKNLSTGLMLDAYEDLGKDEYQIHYYEKPWLKFLRQFRSGERPPLSNLFVSGAVNGARMRTHSHHLSHAAAGFQTSPFDHATVVIIDAIGEFDTITIWDAHYDESNGKAKYKKLWSKSYPDSIGLFYSAMTKRAGLKPLDEEYILMGMAAYGSVSHYEQMRAEFLSNAMNLDFKQNLHIGAPAGFLAGANNMDIAASSQLLVEHMILSVIKRATQIGHSTNLVYGGGVALNCLANSMVAKYFNKIWIMPNPGDAGSSLGAAALGFKYKIEWTNAYLGHDIPGEYPVDAIVTELQRCGIVGVANGRAEFGPRALGNRSLLADPRGPNIKDAVNEIKRRQKFRPFAPVIMEEFASHYFDMPGVSYNHRYMQFVSVCRFPELYPAIVHRDDTSRVQTVPNDGSGIRRLLEKWYALTGCPMLLNTSLNIRGEPMVNDREDADRFEKLYSVRVFS